MTPVLFLTAKQRDSTSGLPKRISFLSSLPVAPALPKSPVRVARDDLYALEHLGLEALAVPELFLLESFLLGASAAEMCKSVACTPKALELEVLSFLVSPVDRDMQAPILEMKQYGSDCSLFCWLKLKLLSLRPGDPVATEARALSDWEWEGG